MSELTPAVPAMPPTGTLDTAPGHEARTVPAHLVRFYNSDEVLEGVVARFLGEGMSEGDVLTVIATEEHTRAFERHLESEGRDLTSARSSGRLLILDASETLERFMRDGVPDAQLFEAEVGGLIEQRAAFADGARMRAYGEMVDVLWRQGNRTAAVRLEELWNDLQTRHPFTLLCAYAMGGFYKEPAAFQRVCRTHTHVVGEGWDGAGDPTSKVHATSPQDAHPLALEIAHRAEVESALRDSLRELRQREEHRAAVAARAERLVKITAAIAEAVTADEVFEAVVDHVAAALDASSAGLWLVEDDGRTVKLARSFGYEESASQRFDGLSLDADPSVPALDSIRRGEALWIPSQDELLREYPHLRVSATSGRSYRVSCLPLISQGRILGALGLTIEEARRASDDERSFLLLVARYASQAIERLRLLETESRSRVVADKASARMSVLSRVSRTFVDANLDLGPRLEDIVHELGDVLDSCAGIALLEADGRLHTVAVHHPLPAAEEALRSFAATEPRQVGEGVTGTVAQTGETVFMPVIDVREFVERAAPAYRAFLERYPVYAMICVPLCAHGRVIGTVTAMRTREGESYTRDDLDLLEELAERAAPAIENSRLHHENLEARSRAELLYQFAKSVVSAERVEQVFDAALEAIGTALGSNRGAILIYDNTQVMRFRAWRHLSDEYMRAVEGHSPWKPDAVAPEPVLVPDVEHDASWRSFLPLFRQERIGSLAFIPLVTRGRLIGKFMVYFGRPHAYSSNEIELATSIASHLASVTARFAATAKLEETIRYNDLFSGVLAHDLRNPLGAMMSAAQVVLMRQEGEGDRNAKPLSRILASGQRMTRMIDQLLDVTRVRVGGGIQIEPCEASLSDLCRQATGELELAYPNWRIECEVVGDPNGIWDPDRLLQIISNLVGNAGQHGDGNSPIAIRLDGRGTDAVTLQVHNQGVIPDAMLASLFDPFRGTRHRRDYSRGLGLGLFIVNEIVRAHGGTAEVASSSSEGTTFTIRLPRRAAASAAFAVGVATQGATGQQ